MKSGWSIKTGVNRWRLHFAIAEKTVGKNVFVVNAQPTWDVDSPLNCRGAALERIRERVRQIHGEKLPD